MKTHLKKMVIALVAVGFLALSACDKHTCPTYSKNETQSQGKHS